MKNEIITTLIIVFCMIAGTYLSKAARDWGQHRDYWKNYTISILAAFIAQLWCMSVLNYIAAITIPPTLLIVGVILALMDRAQYNSLNVHTVLEWAKFEDVEFYVDNSNLLQRWHDGTLQHYSGASSPNCNDGEWMPDEVCQLSWLSRKATRVGHTKVHVTPDGEEI
jgi:hypothetical protein